MATIMIVLRGGLVDHVLASEEMRIVVLDIDDNAVDSVHVHDEHPQVDDLKEVERTIEFWNTEEGKQGGL